MMTAKDNTAALIDVLRRECNVHEAILAAEMDQKRRLAAGDIEGVLDSVNRLTALADHARGLEAERAAATDAVSGETEAAVTLRALLDRVPVDSRPVLEDVGNRLRELVERVRRQNLINRAVLLRSMETFENEAAECARNGKSGVYGPDGETRRTGAGPARAGLNVRA